MCSTVDDVPSRVRDAQVLELITIVSEITNVLNFDLKHIELKEEQIKELKTQQHQAESANNQEIEQFKAKIKKDIEQVKVDYEQEIKKNQESQQELERELTKKHEDMRKQMEEEVEQKDGELKSACEAMEI